MPTFPDNIAPPVAACLGDLVTLLLLGAVSTVNIVLIDTPLALILLIALTVAAVGWAILTRRNTHVRHLLLEGWVPLFAAMIISCGTGIVLDRAVAECPRPSVEEAAHERHRSTRDAGCKSIDNDAFSRLRYRASQ